MSQIIDPRRLFSYSYLGKDCVSNIQKYYDDDKPRYQVYLESGIQFAIFRMTVNFDRDRSDVRVMWVQHKGDTIQPPELIEAMGVGVEKAGLL